MAIHQTSKQVEELVQPFIKFLGEQDGPVERQIERKLVSLFDARPDVSRAYLCRIRYPSAEAVALVLSAPEDPGLAAMVAEVFATMFGRELNEGRGTKSRRQLRLVGRDRMRSLVATATPR